MLTKWVLLTSVLSVCSTSVLQAHPLDSRDIVYFDGLPCNSACQSYMAWSRQTLSMSGQPAPGQFAKRSTNAVAGRTTRAGAERSKPSASARVAKLAVPIPRQMPQTGTAALQPADTGAPKSDITPAKIADLPAAVNATANSGTRTIQEQVAAATTLAEHVTTAKAVPAPEQKSHITDSSDHLEAVRSSDAETAVPASQNDTDNLVALLMARPEIKSVSDLANKDVAIEDRQSASSASVRAAIAAAGAAEARLSEGHDKAIDRLVSGEVPAAVLALVSPEAAEWFPDIKGFKIFRIPLPPRSLKARL